MTDFGIAHAHGQGVTQTGMITDAQLYRAGSGARPPLRPRVDIFALGVTLRAMAGFPPFDGDTDYAIIYKVASGDPPPPAGRGARYPSAIAEHIRSHAAG